MVVCVCWCTMSLIEALIWKCHRHVKLIPRLSIGNYDSKLYLVDTDISQNFLSILNEVVFL